MTTLEIWLMISLTLSAIFNVLLFLFAKEQSQRISYFSQNLTDLIDILKDYNTHLKKVYSLDTFYGDETLTQLLHHTRALSDLLERDYSEIIRITEPLEIIIEEESNEETEETEETKDVLYAGTRKRNS